MDVEKIKISLSKIAGYAIGLGLNPQFKQVTDEILKEVNNISCELTEK